MRTPALATTEALALALTVVVIMVVAVVSIKGGGMTLASAAIVI